MPLIVLNYRLEILSYQQFQHSCFLSYSILLSHLKCDINLIDIYIITSNIIIITVLIVRRIFANTQVQTNSTESTNMARSKILQNRTNLGILLAILGASLWGVSGACGQFLIQQRGQEVDWLITVRMLIAGFLLLVITYFSKKDNDVFHIWKSKKDIAQLLLFTILGMLPVQFTYFQAVKYSNAATATILQYAGPVLIVLYVAIKSRKFPTIKETVAVLLAITGTFLLVTHGNIHSLSISKPAMIWGICSAVALAVYTLLPVRLLTIYSAMTVVGWAMLLGGIIFSFVKAPWQIVGIWDVNTYLLTAFLVIFGTLIPFSFYLLSVKWIGGEKSSVLASAEPLSATIIAVFWLGISFQTMDWIGGICILSTIFILSIGGKKEKLAG